MEKRRHERFVREIKVSYSVLSKADSTPFEFGEAMTIDISSGGVALLVQECIPVPALLQLHMHVPRSPSDLAALGKTVHCSPIEGIGMYRVGIKFIGLPPSDLDKAFGRMGGT